MEKSIRVLVANHPRLMREIVLTTFADQSQISESVKKTLPNFVVVALDQPGVRPHICDVLLREHPEVHVIAVAAESNYIVYYWASFEIHSNKIEASEEGILNAMRRKLVTNGAN